MIGSRICNVVGGDFSCDVRDCWSYFLILGYFGPPRDIASSPPITTINVDSRLGMNDSVDLFCSFLIRLSFRFKIL